MQGGSVETCGQFVGRLTYVGNAKDGQEGESENEDSGGTHVDGRRVKLGMLKRTSGREFDEAKLCAVGCAHSLTGVQNWVASSPAC